MPWAKTTSGAGRAAGIRKSTTISSPLPGVPAGSVTVSWFPAVGGATLVAGVDGAVGSALVADWLEVEAVDGVLADTGRMVAVVAVLDCEVVVSACVVDETATVVVVGGASVVVLGSRSRAVVDDGVVTSEAVPQPAVKAIVAVTKAPTTVRQ